LVNLLTCENGTEPSINDYHSTLRNTPEERWSQHQELLNWRQYRQCLTPTRIRSPVRPIYRLLTVPTALSRLTDSVLSNNILQYDQKNCLSYTVHSTSVITISGLFCPFPNNGAPMEWNWQGKTEVLGEKPVPVPLCLPQIPHGLTRDRTRASAVGGRRLTAWAMARPYIKWPHQFICIVSVIILPRGFVNSLSNTQAGIPPLVGAVRLQLPSVSFRNLRTCHAKMTKSRNEHRLPLHCWFNCTCMQAKRNTNIHTEPALM
jgi:hypothetical protein